MNSIFSTVRRLLPAILGASTLAAAVLLLAQDGMPRFLASVRHEFLAAFSLALIAVAYLIFLLLKRSSFAELARGILLVAAFLFWAANQLWSNLPQAALFNDIAIGLFVLDVFLAIVGWPPAAPDQFFSNCHAARAEHCAHGCCCGDLRDAAGTRGFAGDGV